MIVILTHDKYGTGAYSTALGLLTDRYSEGYWYDGVDAENAEEIIDAQDENAAWKFLVSRNHYEYEGVEKVVLR